MISRKGKDKFREIMREVRAKSKLKTMATESERALNGSEYIPLTFEAMLRYLHESSKRKLLAKSIHANHREFLDSMKRGGEETSFEK